MSISLPPVLRGSLLLLLFASPLGAQSDPAATSYLERFQEIWRLEPAPDQMAEVHGLVLSRDRAELRLEEGRLYLLTSIGGRTPGAVFRGKGRLLYNPALEIERQRLARFNGAPVCDEPFTEMVLLFADSTLAELQRQLKFGPGEAPGGLKGRVKELLEYYGDGGDKYLDPDLLRPLLNGEATGLFLAMVIDQSHDPWVFMINPHELEGDQLHTRPKHPSRIQRMEVITQNRRPGETSTRKGERRPEARIRHYQLEVRLPQNTVGDLKLQAAALVEITADTTVGPWIAFYLYPELEVDSASWPDERPATVFKPKDMPYLWVRLEQPLKAGDVRPLTLYYHGDLLERFGDWFYLKDAAGWYPVALEGRNPATFDVTYVSPKGFLLASVGNRTEMADAPNHMVRTRWITPSPISLASFNVGLYDEFQVQEPGAPPVTVLWSDQMHRAISRGGAVLQGKNMKSQVGQDVANAMKFFREVYGELPLERFYVTETPANHGLAFAGMVHLSFVTFQNTQDDGFDEFFRAHEVAHQWWPHAVLYATYRDRWLSEGLASFSGLWYLQTRRKSNDKYFDMLGRWKAGIMLRRDDALPLWLGHRVATYDRPEDYQAIIYDKGAWVMHMLRILLLDLKAMKEDRFTETMRSFYRTHRGGQASTADFQRAVEQQTGQDMSWFFNQWVYGGAIPTYRVAWRSDPESDGSYRVKLRVTQQGVPDSFLMYVPVTVTLGKDQFVRLRVKVTGGTSQIDLPPMPSKPQAVKFNDFEGVLAEVKNEGW